MCDTGQIQRENYASQPGHRQLRELNKGEELSVPKLEAGEVEVEVEYFCSNKVCTFLAEMEPIAASTLTVSSFQQTLQMNTKRKSENGWNSISLLCGGSE